jgi:hypothetical protein
MDGKYLKFIFLFGSGKLNKKYPLKTILRYSKINKKHGTIRTDISSNIQSMNSKQCISFPICSGPKQIRIRKVQWLDMKKEGEKG